MIPANLGNVQGGGGMIRGLLVDLDDTLLANDTSRFLPVYFQRLSLSFPGQASPDDVLAQLLRATKRMMENRDPLKTLKEVFDAAFYPALGMEAEFRPTRRRGFLSRRVPRTSLARRAPAGRRRTRRGRAGHGPPHRHCHEPDDAASGRGAASRLGKTVPLAPTLRAPDHLRDLSLR